MMMRRRKNLPRRRRRKKKEKNNEHDIFEFDLFSSHKVLTKLRIFRISNMTSERNVW
jgi:hypothetical protein